MLEPQGERRQALPTGPLLVSRSFLVADSLVEALVDMLNYQQGSRGMLANTAMPQRFGKVFLLCSPNKTKKMQKITSTFQDRALVEQAGV